MAFNSKLGMRHAAPAGSRPAVSRCTCPTRYTPHDTLQCLESCCWMHLPLQTAYYISEASYSHPSGTPQAPWPASACSAFNNSRGAAGRRLPLVQSLGDAANHAAGMASSGAACQLVHSLPQEISQAGLLPQGLSAMTVASLVQSIMEALHGALRGRASFSMQLVHASGLPCSAPAACATRPAQPSTTQQ